MMRNCFKPLSTLTLALLLGACGGSNQDVQTQSEARLAAYQESDNTDITPPLVNRLLSESVTGTSTANTQISSATASHFLAQATFGPSGDSINKLVAIGNKSDWLNAEFKKSQTSHRKYVQQAGLVQSPGYPTQDQFFQSFWKQAALADDQLRQRVTYALSQIFVISFVDSSVLPRPAGVANYYDTLGYYAFGNFRDLLQAVALHPMMGIYLSHLHNQKESGTRMPDENFAREIMQLMTIGLHQLNQDGSIKTANGQPIETYTHDDVMGLAKVFTGWSWAGPDQAQQRFFGNIADPSRDWTPMQMYPNFHSASPKSFLDIHIGGGTSGEADLKVALDTLFNHPNVGPFIGRQLIQRLVSSNPSSAYVSRVAAAFANNGAGVRGDMRAVIRAVLLDSEAVDNGTPKKLREPILRLGHWMRAFYAKSVSGNFLLTTLDDPLDGLGQTPMRSPSVFNFYRPQYTPPNSALSSSDMVAPEMQLTAEPSVTGYVNFMLNTIPYGAGPGRDVQADYTVEVSLAPTPEKLLDRVTLLLLAGKISTTLRTQILGALNAIPQPIPKPSNATQVEAALRQRVHMAILLIMVSPEYLAQR